MHDLLLDVRHALRGFRKTPAFTLVAVLSLALAIGANGFVLAVLNTAVLRPFEVSDPQSLYQIRYGPQMSGSNLTTSYPAFQDLRGRNTSFSDMIGIYAYSEARLGGRDAGPRLSGVAVSGSYFDMLGVQPQVGRLLHASDERGLNSAPYVVLSDALWRRVFGGDPGVVGTSVRLNEQPFTVIGVAAASFHGTERFSWPDYWIPIVNNLGGSDYLQSRNGRAVLVIGRLKPGVTQQQATADLSAITAQLANEYPKTDKGVSVRLIRPGLMGDTGEGIRRFLYSVNVLALLLLVAVCVNLASAFAARAADRSRELAVRVALGSSQLRLVRQLLTGRW
jgi:predicted permease